MRTIAYLGPEQTNTHLAAVTQFGQQARYIPELTVENVFHLVERRQADYGVVAVENSQRGAITHTLDRFIDFPDTPVKIHGEIEQPIHHYLILHKRTKLSMIAAIYSHPQALAQCYYWLVQKFPQADRRETESTVGGISHLLHGRNREMFAVIGRHQLARKYRLKAIRIPQERENKTRFLILGLGEPPKGKYNKTSIMFALKDKPGALHDVLVPFKHNRINLTKIESRPSRQKAWEYIFFIDVEGHVSEPRVQRALAALQRSTSSFQLLGSYPIASR